MDANYSQLFQAKNDCGEQVLFVKFWKNSFDRKIFEAQTTIVPEMKNRLAVIISVMLLAVTSTFAALPSVPSTNEVARYDLEDGTIFPRTRGDALLSALDDGRQLQEIHHPPEMIWDPAPPRYSLNLILTNGNTNSIGISDGFVVVSNRYYGLTDAAQKQIAKVNDAFDADARQEKETLRKQLVSAPKPLVYTVGAANDGGTLSGIAKMFYGDATKWKLIYEANQQLIKNPDKITDGMKLTIPKLQ